MLIPSVEVTELVEEVLPEDGNGTESEVKVLMLDGLR